MSRAAPTHFPGFQSGPPTLRQHLLGHAPTRRRRWLWAATAACVLATLALHAHTQRLQAAQQALAATQRMPAPAPRSEWSAAQQARWRLALKQLNADWRAWFEALERHTPDAVVLRAIEPDAESGELRVQGEAADLDPLMAWARALGGEARFASVRPLQHQSQDGPAGPTVLLTLAITLADPAEPRPTPGLATP